MPKGRGPGPGKGGPPGVSTEKAKDFKGTIKKIISYLKPFKKAIIVVILFSIASSAFSIVGPKIIGNATTLIFEGLVDKITGGGIGIDFSCLTRILLFLLVIYIISSILSFIQSFIMVKVSVKVSYNLRKAISEKIHRLPMKYFDKMTHGEILSRVTNDVDTVSQNLEQSLTQIISSITTVIGVLIMMISINGTLTLASLLMIPFSVSGMAFIVKRSQKYFEQQQEYLGHVNGHIEEIYGGHTIVKAFNREDEALSEFSQYNETLYHSAWKSQFLSGMMHPIMNFIGNLGYVMIIILGSWLTVKERIKVGDILSFTQYIRNFTQPLSHAAQIMSMLQSTAAAAERVFEFLEEAEEPESTKHPVSTKLVSGAISFEHVKFGYNQDKIIINDFTTKVKKGQKIAIVGPTGAGKTTIVKLLMRFYDINSGSIKVDGHDIKDFNRDELRKLFGMVLQDTWLFSGMIKDNIRYGRLEATDEEVKQAAKAAHIHHFVKTMDDGYDTMLTEDASNISQGQRQLMTIARVILADPKILILDEATSSVDTRTEVLIQQAMDELMEGRTSFIIAHRLSTIKNADLILVMNDGDIVETGNHEQLLKKGGFYAKLYQSQFEEV